MTTPHHAIRIEYTRSQDLIQHAPGARRERWTTIIRNARNIERLGSTLGWLPYNSLYYVVDADNVQSYYLAQE